MGHKQSTQNIRPIRAELWYLPVETRIPLKFGPEVLTHVTCARCAVTVKDRQGHEAVGWGETPLSVQWVWPGALSYDERYQALKGFCERLASTFADFPESGHPLEVGYAFQQQVLPELLAEYNRALDLSEPMPYLAALVCLSLFDIALHDAYGALHNIPVYQTYNSEWMTHDLRHYVEPATDSHVNFKGLYPEDFFQSPVPTQLAAWHLVGGKDLLYAEELIGNEPDDGYPVLLSDWIQRDGLKCLKVKLRGNEAVWDYERLVQVGTIGLEYGVEWLTVDFNCTVTDPSYVNDILDRLMCEYPRLYGMILYVEQPFPYELRRHQIDVHSVSARKPLFMDESAHDWRVVRLGRTLGWTGVALKTCKTQTGALLSLCWAKAHGMTLMVQDLTNPMLAQIPHVLLAAYAGTIMGVETNAMQFYPDASLAEAAVHPGLYRRRHGMMDLTTIHGAGFGYRLNEIERTLPEAVQF
ncbi:MAG: mandelate racemase/muconate lactonizing enzyme family protein [bacterium]|nr:mandelate racemase/muconate lactonizing enzyme family protein [bacterium]